MNVKGNSETEFQNPNIVENIDYPGGFDFDYLFNVKIQNDQYTFISLLRGKKTNWLRCTDFDFNLPNDSIIEGIEVRIDDFDGFFDKILAFDIYLVLNGIKIGIDKESGTSIGIADFDFYRIYGSSTDMWSTELIKSDIESSTFGVQIFYYNSDTRFTNNVNVDNIQIKIYYSILEPEPEPEPNIDFIIILSLLGIFSIMILILMFSILLIKNGK